MFAIKSGSMQISKCRPCCWNSKWKPQFNIISALLQHCKEPTSFIKAARQNLVLSENAKIAQLKMDIGSGFESGFPAVSQTNENVALSDLMQLIFSFWTLKRPSMVLLNNSTDTDFNVADTILVNYDPVLDDLKKHQGTSNASLLISRSKMRAFWVGE